MNELKKAIYSHSRLRFPDFPEDDGFSDWVMDLIETDAYYVGIAQSVQENQNPQDINFQYVDTLKKDLDAFSESICDQEIYLSVVKYVDSLKKLVSLIECVSNESK